MKFHSVKKDLNKYQFNRLLSIIRSQNRSSILSNLSSNNIKNYINIVIKNKNMELFVASNPKIIGYAIIANKPGSLIKYFKKLKIKIFLDLLLRFKLFTLINIFFSLVSLDTAFLSKRNKYIIKSSVNLNLLAIDRNHQGQNLGGKFLRFIIKRTNFKTKYISCETDNFRSSKFYIKKLQFKFVGYKIRIPKLFEVLIKKIY